VTSKNKSAHELERSQIKRQGPRQEFPYLEYTVYRVSDNSQLSGTHFLHAVLKIAYGNCVAETGPGWQKTVHKLQPAIQEHALRLTNMTTAATVGGRPVVFIERRDRTNRNHRLLDVVFMSRKRGENCEKVFLIMNSFSRLGLRNWSTRLGR